MIITILYGKIRYVDVTDKIFSLANQVGDVVIPANDCARFDLFKEDPVFGVVKDIVIIKDGQIEIYDHTEKVSLNISNCTPSSQQLAIFHKNLIFNHGNINDEYPEQLLAIKYLNPEAIVLELGANIGRNSLLIANIVNNQKNFVTLECDLNSVKCLTENRDNNNFSFNIEDCALSKRPLIQKGGDTKTSEVLEEGWNWVKTITFKELEEKYKLKFNTIVADCEGALYDILKDDPNILNNIDTVILENDFWDIEKKYFVDSVMRSRGLQVFHQERGGWGPCQEKFFEVWKRHSFGFFILRNVCSETTNRYWQEAFNCIRRFFKYNRIVIIDDNSDEKFLSDLPVDENLILINSEYKQRGELLPYIYYIKNNWFDNAVIYHDSVFINDNMEFAFKNFKFLWDFHNIFDHHESQEILLNALNNSEELRNFRQTEKWTGCFGCMMMINRQYLLSVNEKYNFFNLIDHVVDRERRCGFERILALTMQCYNKTMNESMLGSIHRYCKWEYTYDEYLQKKPNLPLIKVWSGR